ncbi:DUF202 domain-containing protein [Nocardioides sp. ChNu-99]|uniref:YidH family protein n=1 Tax=Nocardioides sp. ChNu-99 TaxID=2839897 RepID=UPI0024072B7D|nr:DUF202 domain-containing protein [Nocardioides sp. ChNu-99]MDF9716134.1 DUF202 domain-containing protein [Nocardioides sp. ChNu-99]
MRPGPRAAWRRPLVEGEEPDARFTLANERTFLAWTRTALALVVAALALEAARELVLPGPAGRVLVVATLGVAAAVAVQGCVHWRAVEAALRSGRPLPRAAPVWLVAYLVVAAVGAAASLGLGG